MNTKSKFLAACALIIPVAMPVTAMAQDVPSEAVVDDSEIIVTASKREERLQDAPSAITALSSATIDKLGIANFRDYASLVPGLSQRDSGIPGAGTVILRGLNSGPQQTTNTAAFYIDDTPFSASGYLSVAALMTPEPELAEVERIEVLKGPQGTLYGAGSLGGLIRIVTKKPDPSRFYGSVRGEVSTVDGGEEGFLVRGTVNVPIVSDVLAVSATGYYRRLPGFVDNLTTGTRNVNRNNISGGRIALFAEPAPGLKINLSGQIQDIDGTGSSGVELLPGTFQPAFGHDRRYAYTSFLDLPQKIKYRLVSGSIEYDTGIGTITGAASYAKYDVAMQFDYTSVYIPAARGVLAPLSEALFGVPIDTLLPADSNARGLINPAAEKYSGELRFTSKRLGPVEFIAGLFYTHEDSAYVTNIYPYTAAGAPFAAPFDYLIKTTTLSEYEEIAGFGNLTFYIADNFDVTGGIRYAHAKQLATTGADNAITYFLPRAASAFPLKENATTYLATVRWRPTDNISLFARAASGYRPGGPQTNSNPPAGAQRVINSDTVWNYEAGIKGTALDGTFSYDLSVYHIDWKDIQLNALYTGFVLGGNGGSAAVDGFELQMQMRPSPLLTVGANVGHTDARLKTIVPEVALVLGAQPGDQLPLSPKWTVALTADHVIPFSESVRGNVGATLRFQSEAAATYPALDPGPTRMLPELTTLDLRASASFDDRFTLQLRVDNAFNKFGFTNIDGSGSGVVIRPRTISLSLGANF